MSQVGDAIRRGLSTVTTRDYRFSIDGITDANGRATTVLSQAAAWNYSDPTLSWNGDDIVFGPASSDWGVVKTITCETEFGGAYKELCRFGVGGSSSTDSNGNPVFDGKEVLEGQILNVNSFGIDYSTTTNGATGDLVFAGATKALFDQLEFYSNNSFTWDYQSLPTLLSDSASSGVTVSYTTADGLTHNTPTIEFASTADGSDIDSFNVNVDGIVVAKVGLTQTYTVDSGQTLQISSFTLNEGGTYVK
jgi:hypothetical protein